MEHKNTLIDGVENLDILKGEKLIDVNSEMTQMLGLSDKEFEIATIDICQQANDQQAQEKTLCISNHQENTNQNYEELSSHN